MSTLSDAAIRAAGLGDVLDARAHGEMVVDASTRLHAADLLVLGALADRVRALEVGDVVRVLERRDADAAPDVVTIEKREEGLSFLRDVSIARLTAPKGARIRVDFNACGLELAQVALGFGANELVGELSTKRGLPIAEGTMATSAKKSLAQPLQVVKKKELAGFIARSGRRAVFAGGVEEAHEDEPHAAAAGE
jgi:hypothetical protein